MGFFFFHPVAVFFGLFLQISFWERGLELPNCGVALEKKSGAAPLSYHASRQWACSSGEVQGSNSPWFGSAIMPPPVRECEVHKEDRHVLEEEMRTSDVCDMEGLGRLESSEKTVSILGDRWWP